MAAYRSLSFNRFWGRQLTLWKEWIDAISEKGDNKNYKDGVQRSNLLHSDRIVVSHFEVHLCKLECPCRVLLVKECREENKCSQYGKHLEGPLDVFYGLLVDADLGKVDPFIETNDFLLSLSIILETVLACSITLNH